MKKNFVVVTEIMLLIVTNSIGADLLCPCHSGDNNVSFLQTRMSGIKVSINENKIAVGISA